MIVAFLRTKPSWILSKTLLSCQIWQAMLWCVTARISHQNQSYPQLRFLRLESWGLSVGASDAGILASDFCDAPTDTTLLDDNWQPLAAAKQRKTDTLRNLLLASFVYILEEGVVHISKQQSMSFWNEGGGIVAGDLWRRKLSQSITS